MTFQRDTTRRHISRVSSGGSARGDRDFTLTTRVFPSVGRVRVRVHFSPSCAAGNTFDVMADRSTNFSVRLICKSCSFGTTCPTFVVTIFVLLLSPVLSLVFFRLAPFMPNRFPRMRDLGPQLKGIYVLTSRMNICGVAPSYGRSERVYDQIS